MRKRACLVASASHQREFAGAFAAGLRRHGWETSIERRPVFGRDLLVMWGVRNRQAISMQKIMGGETCILERGYIGDRFKWTSVSFGGGLNGRGEFRGHVTDASRFERNFGHLMRPWTRRKGYALLIGQVPTDMSLLPIRGRFREWLSQTSSKLRKQGWEVRFRQHPVIAKPTESLADALAGAGLCVTFNSNTAVESVLAGVPTIAVDQGSMAWPVTSHAVGEPLRRVDRRGWAAELAYKQWVVEEMESGECWAHLSGIEQCAQAI